MIGVVPAVVVHAATLAAVATGVHVVSRRATRRIEESGGGGLARLDAVTPVGEIAAVILGTFVPLLVDVTLGGGTELPLFGVLHAEFGPAGTALVVAPAVIAVGAALQLAVAPARSRLTDRPVQPPTRTLGRFLGKILLGGIAFAAAGAALLAATVSAAAAAAVTIALPPVMMGEAAIQPRLSAWWNRFPDAGSEVTDLLSARDSDVRVYVSPDEADGENLTAVATGFGATKSIVVNASAIRRLDVGELAALLAHECAHHDRNDQLIRAAVPAVIVTACYAVGAALWLTLGASVTGVAAVVAAVAAIVVTATVAARTLHEYPSEYAADAGAVERLSSAEPLVRLLERYEESRESGSGRLPDPIADVLATHPSPRERIDALRHGETGGS